MRIQTVDGDIDLRAAGPTLVHEHLWAAFGGPSGDPDLEFTCEEAICADVAEAGRAGIRTIVDATAVDMGADVERTAAIARQAGVRVVKSAGWFRSPTADEHLAGRTASDLADQLVRELTVGFATTGLRAGCLGEVGLAGHRPTAAESRLLDAVADAGRRTGAGVLLHTDDDVNGRALVDELLARELDPARLLVGHARADDPLAWHVELAGRGCAIGFDQLGHPARDSVARVATRILELLGRVPAARVALSADVGRRSRLRAFGGSGYVAARHELLARLRASGLTEAASARLEGETAAGFLALAEPA